MRGDITGSCISGKLGVAAEDTYGRDFRRLSKRVTLFEIGPDRCDDVSLPGDPVLDISRGCKGTLGLLLGRRVLRVRRSAGHVHSSRPLLLRQRPHGRQPSQRFFLRRPKSQCRQHESSDFRGQKRGRLTWQAALPLDGRFEATGSDGEAGVHSLRHFNAGCPFSSGVWQRLRDEVVGYLPTSDSENPNPEIRRVAD
jgi:hypothetical protein